MNEQEIRLRKKINDSREKVARLLLDCYSDFENDLSGGWKIPKDSPQWQEAEQKFYYEVLKNIGREIRRISPFDE